MRVCCRSQGWLGWVGSGRGDGRSWDGCMGDQINAYLTVHTTERQILIFVSPFPPCHLRTIRV